MTVCIAARSSRLGVIVSITDLMLSDTTTAIDNADIKTANLVSGASGRWFVLHSGLPRVYGDLTDHIRATLAGTSGPFTTATMIAAVEQAYDTVINRRIEREVLRQRYGIDFREFRQLKTSKGGGSLVSHIGQETKEARSAIIQEMRWQDPTELIIGGFDDNRTPHIFSCDGIGQCTPRDSYGFHAIGSGGDAAIAWLLANKEVFASESIGEIGYRLCEAKFIAENSPYVGKTSSLLVWYDDGNSVPVYMPYGLDWSTNVIREAWNARIEEPPNAQAVAEIELEIRAASRAANRPAYATLTERNSLKSP